MIVGSAITEIIKEKVLSSTCGELLGREWILCILGSSLYDDPENPQLEAMNSVCMNCNYDIVVKYYNMYRT